MPSFIESIYRVFDMINPYHWVTWLRNRAFDRGIIESRLFEIPVICIGNITVGGTGKTPHTEYLIRLLKKKYRSAVLSRGYGRRSKGFIKAENSTSMQQIGDEPYQIKQKFNDITVAVDEKRVHGIETLLKLDSTLQVILLDDAYQHRYVKAGLNILLVDINRPLWRDSVLPIGRLRESVAGIERADIIIVTKCPTEIEREKIEECSKRLLNKKKSPIFFSTMQYGAVYPLFRENCKSVELKEGIDIVLITGIARPAPLKSYLESLGASVTLMQFPDHHIFTEKELQEICDNMAGLSKESIIITTEKDATRLQGHKQLLDSIKEKMYVIPIEVAILDNKQNMLNQIVLDYVAKNSRNSRFS